MDDKIKIKGDKGTKGRKDKNKKNIYSSKHIRNQIKNKTTSKQQKNDIFYEYNKVFTINKPKITQSNFLIVLI